MMQEEREQAEALAGEVEQLLREIEKRGGPVELRPHYGEGGIGPEYTFYSAILFDGVDSFGTMMFRPRRLLRKIEEWAIIGSLMEDMAVSKGIEANLHGWVDGKGVVWWQSHPTAATSSHVLAVCRVWLAAHEATS